METGYCHGGEAAPSSTYSTSRVLLVRFDLTAVPNLNKVALVNSATLRLYRSANTYGNGSWYAGQLAESWVEGTGSGLWDGVCDGAMWYTRNAGTVTPVASLVSYGGGIWYIPNVTSLADDPVNAGKKFVRSGNSPGNYNNTQNIYTHYATLVALQGAGSTRGYFWDSAAACLYVNKNDVSVRWYATSDMWATAGAGILGSYIKDKSAAGPPVPGWIEIEIAPIVRNWVLSAQANNGVRLYGAGQNTIDFKEYTTDPTLRPELVLDVTYYGTPNAVTNLAAGNPDWFKLDLTWTAPSAVPPGAVASYDLRYSTSPITDDATFAAATPVTGLPAPAAPGTAQSKTVTGLSGSTTYYFAMKDTDAVGTVSALSNLASGTTIPQDAIPPASVTNLAVVNTKPNYVQLSWAATGDDGTTGLATGYDLRYSTSSIVDDASFAAATAVTGLPAPKAPGGTEAITVHGLTPSTTYYFAIKVRDEVPNWSALSNVPSTTTLAQDLLPPVTISDLHVQTVGIHVIYLGWTAPADQGSAGTAAYDMRYSTSPVSDDATFAAATPVAGVQAPAAPNTPESFMIAGLSASTTYYFAIKTSDYAEPANVSALSNVVNGTTMPPIVPVTVHNPWIVNDRVADTHNVTTMGNTYVNAYTPDGVVTPSSNQDKAINIYNNQKRRLYHWADEPPSVGGNSISDPTYNQNVFGWGLCGRHADQACTIANAAGIGQRKTSVPGDWQYELYYDGGYHLFHTMMTFYVFTRDVPPHIASSAEIAADNTICTAAAAEGRACPGFLLCGDTAAWEADACNHYSPAGSGVVSTLWTGNVDVRLGQSLYRGWDAWNNEYPTPHTDADGGNIPGPDAPYHHECQNDWKDYVNYAYWEPYGAIISYINTSKATYRRWSNGTDTLAPDFRSAGYQAMLQTGSHDLATWNDDSLTPDLHCAAANTTAEAIFKINVPFYITDAVFSGDFVKATSSDTCSVFFSSDGSSWTGVWSASSTGTTHVANQSLRTNVFGLWATWYVKLQFKGVAAKTNAGVSNFSVVTTFEHNKGALPYLDKGINHLTLTFDNAAELQASRNILHVVYKWKEYDGSGWNVDQHYDGYFQASPSTFTIATAGTKVPRTEYILVEVIEPIIDLIPPGQITDLAAGTPGACRVPLTWTATGDDGGTGTAMAYDLRYSSSPITDDATFNAATQFTGVPAPKISGSTESFTVTGLTPLTTSYFAIKAIDKGNNRGPLSNLAGPVTTPALLPVSNLAAGTPTWSKVPLTWTAIDDGSVGQETSYDLRYSTSPITDANFAAATVVTGVPAPKPAGQAESFSVKGLLGGTTYYFAIKGIDNSAHASPLSNIASVTTGVTPLVADLNAVAGSNKVALTWTAIDDGNLGKMSSYDLRYSASNITDANFSSATQVTGLSAPKTAGQAEAFTVTGLSASTTYYFAIKGIDSFSHASPISNIAVATTTPADVTPPAWIGNLMGSPSGTGGGVDLTWTAPADYGYGGSGPFICTSYQLRYSTSPIAYDDGGVSWNAATAVTGLPAPNAPGIAETLTVAGLTGGTTYYFAIKAVDDSGNVSEVSNSAPAVASVLGNKTLQNGLNRLRRLSGHVRRCEQHQLGFDRAHDDLRVRPGQLPARPPQVRRLEPGRTEHHQGHPEPVQLQRRPAQGQHRLLRGLQADDRLDLQPVQLDAGQDGRELDHGRRRRPERPGRHGAQAGRRPGLVQLRRDDSRAGLDRQQRRQLRLDRSSAPTRRSATRTGCTSPTRPPPTSGRSWSSATWGCPCRATSTPTAAWTSSTCSIWWTASARSAAPTATTTPAATSTTTAV